MRGMMAVETRSSAKTPVDRRVERLAALAFAAADVLFEVDRAFRIRHAGGAVTRLTGHTGRTVRGLSLFDLIVPADRIYLRRSIEELDQKKETSGRVSLRFLRPEGEAVTAVLGMAATPGAPGERLVTATIVDPGRAVFPGKDGLLEREPFIEFVTRLAARPGQDTRFRMVMVSLPRLLEGALREDTMLGRAFLAEVEAILRTNSEGNAVTRLDGACFAYVESLDADPELVPRQIRAVADSILAQSRTSRLPLDSALMEQKELELALDFALRAFTDRSVGTFPFDNLPECLAAASRRNQGLAASCRDIIEDDTFYPVLQPVVALKTGLVQHYEVLTRFRHDGAGGVSNAGEFIKVAEQIGMIGTFDLLNCFKVLTLLQKFPPHVRLAMNVSGRSVQSEEFGDRLLNMLEASETRISPSRLLIEITETRGITEFERPAALLQKLATRGYRICLDDFGAGAMSFEYLRRLPVNYIKIDGPFFRSAMINTRDRILVRALARCGFELGSRTVAEMIETEAEAALARELGIEYGQGWLFGKPVAAETLLSSLANARPAAQDTNPIAPDPAQAAALRKVARVRMPVHASPGDTF